MQPNKKVVKPIRPTTRSTVSKTPARQPTRTALLQPQKTLLQPVAIPESIVLPLQEVITAQPVAVLQEEVPTEISPVQELPARQPIIVTEPVFDQAMADKENALAAEMVILPAESLTDSAPHVPVLEAQAEPVVAEQAVAVPEEEHLPLIQPTATVEPVITDETIQEPSVLTPAVYQLPTEQEQIVPVVEEQTGQEEVIASSPETVLIERATLVEPTAPAEKEATEELFIAPTAEAIQMVPAPMEEMTPTIQEEALPATSAAPAEEAEEEDLIPIVVTPASPQPTPTSTQPADKTTAATQAAAEPTDELEVIAPVSTKPVQTTPAHKGLSTKQKVAIGAGTAGGVLLGGLAIGSVIAGIYLLSNKNKQNGSDKITNAIML
jgi:hypothetical protein